MSYYYSSRAASEAGARQLGDRSTERQGIFEIAKGFVKGGGHRKVTDSYSPSPTDAVDELLRNARSKNRRVASQLDRVESPNQLIDTRLNLQLGCMKFHRIPHAPDIHGEVIAFWAIGEQAQPGVDQEPSDLILCGSLSNISSRDYTEDYSRFDATGFMSDPSSLTSLLLEELGSTSDPDEAMWALGYRPGTLEDGDRVTFAREVIIRAEESVAQGESAWIRDRRSNQRVVATVVDVAVNPTGSKSVLARPILIEDAG